MVIRGARRTLAVGIAVTVVCGGAAPSAWAVGGPSGSGDASSAQYAPFLSGAGGRLKGSYTPPVLSESSPSGLDFGFLAPEVAALVCFGAAGALVARRRRPDREDRR